jgi:aminopeptidase N
MPKFVQTMKVIAAIFCVLMSSLSVMAQGVVSDELLCAEKARLDSRLKFRANPSIYHGYNMVYHRCFWRVNPYKNGIIKGSVTSHLIPDANADSIGFDMKSHLIADSVTLNKSKIRFTRTGDIIYCYKPGGWKKGQFDSLTIHYNGNPAIFGGTGYYVREFHATGPSIHTLSQPYGAYFWWPCKQTLSDKIDSIDIIVSTHPDFRAASNGLLITEQKLNDTTQLYYWKHRYPIATYLVAIAISNYNQFLQYAHFHNRPDSLPVLNYVYPQSETEWKSDGQAVLPMLRLFDSLFGEYPFMKEKYGHAQFPWGGGMEHQTMSFMVNLSYDLVAHELAHMWFGDQVTCGSWNDLWLNEGFATYLTALAYRYLKPDDEWLSVLRNIRRDATSADDGSIFPRDTITVNRLFSGRLTYNKPAFVLHMLRERIGDAAFFRACRKFLAPPRSYAFASTLDLRRIMEQESGQNLDTFFRRWYLGEGFPYLTINWLQKASNVQVTVKQQPSHPSVPFYDVPIPILFSGKTQGGQAADSLIVLKPTQLNQSFTFKLPFATDTAIFDPRITVLAKYSLGGLNQDNIPDQPIVLKGNPVYNNLLELETLNLKITGIIITDAVGRQCFKTDLNFQHSPGNSLSINISDLSPGTYIAKIYGQDQQVSLKFVKVK